METIRPLFWHYPHYGNQGGEPSSIIQENGWKLIHYWEDGRDELYKLQSDIGERLNLVEEHPKVAEELSGKLLKWLSDVGAKIPVPDSDYNAQLALKRHKMLVKEKWPSLEEERLEVLSEDFEPNDDWWGSQITKD